MTEIKTRNGSFPSSDYIQTARCPSGPVVISTYRVAPTWLCVACLTLPPERTQPRRTTAENRNGLNTIKGVDQSVIVNADLSTPLNPILILVRLFRNFLHVTRTRDLAGKPQHWSDCPGNRSICHSCVCHQVVRDVRSSLQPGLPQGPWEEGGRSTGAQLRARRGDPRPTLIRSHHGDTAEPGGSVLRLGLNPQTVESALDSKVAGSRTCESNPSAD